MSQAYTFAFVDLAGFTALTDAHGDQAAAEQVALFCSLAQQSLTGTATVVKSIGDAVMLAADSADDAVRSCLALVQACIAEPHFPLARAGIHSGTAVASGGDFFGAGVNVAARITGRAAGGQLVLTAEPASSARSFGLRVHELGVVDLRNVTDPVELFGVDVELGPHAVDPVCRMTVDRQAAAGTLTHAGHDFWFCSLGCAGAFASNPDRHLAQGRA